MAEIRDYHLPWSLEGPDDFGDFNILWTGESAVVAAVISNCRPPEVTAANAELIVRAVNSHQQLVEALEGLLTCHARYTGEPGHDAAVWAKAEDVALAALAAADALTEEKQP